VGNKEQKEVSFLKKEVPSRGRAQRSHKEGY